MPRRASAPSLAAAAALALAALLAAPAAARAAAPVLPGADASCPTTLAFPGEDWPSAEERVRAARPAEVAALERYAFTLTGPDAERRGIRTDGLVIVHRGQITFERYGRGYGPGNRHLGWSVSKSVTGALAGVAAAHGALAVDDSICRHLPRVPPERCGITVRHLLEYASGLDWTETYEGRAHQDSSVLAMLYGVGRYDMAAFVARHEARAAPGARWAYSSGDALLLAAVAGAAMDSRHGRDWPWRLFFDRLGMASAALERDAAGTLVGSSHLHATPRDLARFGWLYLARGCWRGERILPAGWVEASARVSGPLAAGSPLRHPGEVTGWAFWLNRPVLGEGAPWPGVPEDLLLARGHWGQLVAVIPSLEMVIVRTGDDRDEASLDIDALLSLAAAAGRLP